MRPTSAPVHLKNVVKLATGYRGQRGQVLRSYLFPVLKQVTVSVAVVEDDVWYYVSTADNVGRNMFVRGGREEQRHMAHALALAERVTQRTDLVRGRIFVDIGANIGTSTIPALTTFGAHRAIAVEPGEVNVRLLASSIAANRLEEKVDVVWAAVSDRSGVGVLELSPTSGADNRVRMSGVAAAAADGESERRTVDVPLITFDDLVVDKRLDFDDVGMVWIDVQGHEGHVLAGATSLLETSVPVQIEYWPYGLGRSGGATMLHETIGEHYRRVVDVGASIASGDVVEVPAKDASTLMARYPGQTYTDLLLLK